MALKEYRIEYSYWNFDGYHRIHETYEASSAQEAVDKCRMRNNHLIRQCMEMMIESIHIVAPAGYRPCAENWR